MDRLRKCHRAPVATGRPVEVVRLGDAAYLGAVQTCGSVWACPLCSEKILRGRREELETAVTRWSEMGGRAAMVTLTMRHRRGQRLSDLWDGLQAAWAAARKQRRVRALLEGARWVLRREVTVGANGWHVHAHVLLLLPDGGAGYLDELAAAMFRGWSAQLERDGFEAPLEKSGGLDARMLDLSSARRELAGYLAKGTYEAVDDPAGAIAAELASQGSKHGRRGNRTPMELLADCVAFGLAADVALWWEWEQGSKGRRALTWSEGTRALLLGSESEISDDELAELDDQGGVVVALVPTDTWRSVWRAGGVPDLLDVAERHQDLLTAADAVVAWLAEHHGPAWVPPDLPLRAGLTR